ncbi:MAG TPA: glycosyltransferase family 39 protein [Gaiellales bacterium]|nr:glycosyltransferase family 39 protein [Gaiellales bacterium]
MTDWALTILFCALVTGAGWPWTARIVGDSLGPAVRASFGYLIGAALVTLGELALAFVHIPIVRPTLLAVIAAVTGAGLLAGRGRGRSRPGREPGALWPALVLLAPAALALGVALAQAFLLANVDHIDFLRAWGKKGLSLFYAHNLNFRHLGGPHAYYPLELSNMFGSLYLFLGHVNDTVIRLPMALYGISLVPCMWWMCRRVLPPAGAAGAIALAVTAPEFIIHSSRGQADLATGVYVTIAALGAFLWMLDGGSRYAGLAGFAAGAAAWTKLEGLFTCLAILFGVLIVRRTLRIPGLWVWVAWFATFTIPWKVFQQLHGITLNNRHFRQLYLNMPWILRHVTESLTTFTAWGVFWPLCTALIVLTVPFWWPTQFRWLAAVILPNMVFTLAGFMTQYRAGIAGSVRATASRLYLHLEPSIAVMAAAGATLAITALLATRRQGSVALGVREPAPVEDLCD